MPDVSSRRKIFLLAFLSFFVFHVLLLNINAAEWGDSYRILRASNYVRNLTYPKDEKRPPLFPAILALKPGSIDPILWGRIILLTFSMGSFYIFYKLFFLLSWRNDLTTYVLALIMFMLNPVFLYWSIRVMSDVPFAFICLLLFYLYVLYIQKLSAYKSVLLGIVAAFAALLRFEGYILFGALGLAVLLKKDLKNLAVFAASFVLTILPYLIYKNPLGSSYFEEPAHRTYDLKMIMIYLVSFLFLFGFIQALYFVLKDKRNILNYFVKFPAMTFFIVFELILILFWPAAIPRLFVPIIPFLIIPVSNSVGDYFESGNKLSAMNVGVLFLSVAVYAISQYFLKLQFLVLIKPIFFFIMAFQLLVIYMMYKNRYKIFIATFAFSLLIWSLSTIWIHKDIFRGIKEASMFAKENLNGMIGFNDVSSVADWYIGDRGVKLDITKKSESSYDFLKSKNVKYVLVTNEHNTDMTVDISDKKHLTEINEFKYKINGKIFFTKIIEVKDL